MRARPSSRYLLGVGIAGVIGASAFFAYRAGQNARPPAAAAPASESAETQRLRQEVQRLRGEMAAVATGKASEERARPASPPPSDAETEARARARREALFGVIEAKLGSEAVDPTWAPDATKRLSEAVTSAAPYGKLQAAQCASTLCKLVINHDDPEDVRRFIEEFNEQPVPHGQAVYRYDRESPRPTTTIWLSREGHRLPAPPRS